MRVIYDERSIYNQGLYNHTLVGVIIGLTGGIAGYQVLGLDLEL